MAHERITCVYGTRVKGADFDDGWTLRDASGADLGRFDALVSSDRLMASVAGLPAPPAVDTVLPELNDLPVFADAAGKVESSRALVLMLGFAEAFGDRSVRRRARRGRRRRVLCFEGLVEARPKWRALDRARDAGIRRADAHGRRGRGGPTGGAPEQNAGARRRRGRLLAPWVPELPPPAVAVAHRWGAAFPSKPEGGTPPAISELGGRFVAVGDYLVGPRVEGAVASAEAGARLLIGACA